LDIDYQFISAEELAQSESGSFDVIACLEMLEHVPDPSLIIEACSKLIKPNGQVFFSTINRNPKSYFFAIVGAEYVLNLLPKGTHHYEKFIRPSEIDDWARAYDLSISSMIGMTYNPITKKYKLGDDVSVNYIVHYKKD
jgi:2-polyprenyl-6-hydroxyphenyl methylase/3-demethylubiquinone-9 3-methyltransferase